MYGDRSYLLLKQKVTRTPCVSIPLRITSPTLAMAWGGRGKGGARRVGGGKIGGEKEKGMSATKLKVVDEWQHATKRLLKAYPDKETGTLLKTGCHESLSKLLAKGYADLLRSDACELSARPAMGVHLTASTLSAGFEALTAAASGEGSTGVSKCAALFSVDDLGPVVDLCQVDTEGSTSAKKKALKKLFAFAGDASNAAERLKALASLADTGSRLWSFAIRMAELIAAAAHPKEWAKSVPHEKLHHKTLRKWLKQPKDLERLAEACAVSFEERLHWGGLQRKRKRFGDESDDDSDSSDTSTSGSSSEASDSDSESEDSDAKNKKKHKKTKNKRKSKKASKKSKKEKDKPKDAKKSKKQKKGEKKRVKKEDEDSDAESGSGSELKNKKKHRNVEKKQKNDKESDAESGTGSERKSKNKEKKREKKQKKDEDSDGDSGSSSNSSVRSSAKKDDKKTKNKDNPADRNKAEDKVAAKEVAYLDWSMSAVQELLAAADTTSQGIGRNGTEGVFPVRDIAALQAMIPHKVLATNPPLLKRLTDLENCENVPNQTARRVLNLLTAFGSEVDDWYTSQQSAAGGAPCGSGGAETPKA